MTKEQIETIFFSNTKIKSSALKKYKISLEDLYCMYYNTKPLKCFCGSNTKFINFKKGYNKVCEKGVHCASLFDKNNTEHLSLLINNNKLNPKLTPFIKEPIKNIYDTYYSINNEPLCEVCKKPAKFVNFATGYLDNCGSSVCSQKTSARKLKTENTNIEKYGTKYPMMNVDIQLKSKYTNINKIGVPYPMMSEKVKEKARKVIQEKYNINTNSQKSITNFEHYNEKYIRDNFIKDGFFLAKDLCDYFNISMSNVNKIKSKYSIIEHSKTSKRGAIQENLLMNLIDGTINDRNIIYPLEIDVLSEKHKLGIEYNGLFWHSMGKSKYSMFNNLDVDKLHLLKKTELLEEKGYQLLHIFENEWVYKREIWESMIKSKIHQTTRIPARKCQIKEITSKESTVFLEKNHIQGSINSKLSLGLFYQDELVACMTFGTPRMSKKYQWELHRYCNLLNTTVIGGFSKLLNYFEKTFKPESLVSYANRRWSNGNVYVSNNFVFVHNTKPNFFIFKDIKKVYSRHNFQKHKLKNILDDYSDNKTALQNIIDNNYRVIWDCGNKVYHKIYKEGIK